MKNLLAQVININAPAQFSNLQNIDFGELVTIAITFAIIVAALAFFFMLILGGIKWITSGGDKGKIESARSQITAGLIGLVIVFAAWAILSIVENFFQVNLRSFNLNLLR
ncbi:MAG: hypothetical protein UT39_C0009G0020 [Candidatus Woesebacteria bacterium GW2011_GWA1_39_21]|uniref:Integral membrane protein n=1 Tax=Candidatus Woesebacteria bacterium GW2011_GWA1_39_21 TaxID=1618550 RepID=A0A0G0QLK2_9BACT|nr:MAG: hypothetical protein UT39_C0009G0020 [Candidatus Woesebacteria bacterium GW2011_GWA1_39_21]